MSDVFSKEKRSLIMGRVKGCNTKPELLVRSLIHRMGYRFRLHCKNLPGKPDIVLARHKKAIFVNGCFWHGHEGCSRATRPSSNKDFWRKKINKNVERDKIKIKKLRKLGWKTLILWQCKLKDMEKLTVKLKRFFSR